MNGHTNENEIDAIIGEWYHKSARRAWETLPACTAVNTLIEFTQAIDKLIARDKTGDVIALGFDFNTEAVAWRKAVYCAMRITAPAIRFCKVERETK